MTRGLILALQFLTRLPVPAVGDFRAGDLSASAGWFPFVGLIVGGFVCLPLAATAHAGLWLAGPSAVDPSLVNPGLVNPGLVNPWLGALLGTVAWIWVTGGLHLDGLADLADALGAAHRDRTRFMEVLRDPHLGAFGVMALIVAIVSKLVLLAAAHRSWITWAGLPLLAAWARLGALAWSAWLPALAPGSAERFAWRISKPAIAGWGAALAAASLCFAPALLLAPLAIGGWGAYLKNRIGGVTGDCLGAGIEVVEIVLLLALVLSAGPGLTVGFTFDFSGPA